jgi:hypothetical protein
LFKPFGILSIADCLIKNTHHPFVLVVDSPWGTGKMATWQLWNNSDCAYVVD